MPASWPIKHEWRRFPIIEVLWIDSGGGHSWKDRESELEAPARISSMLCRSVGYLVEDAPHLLMLAESITDNDNLGCTMNIPRFAVVSIERLRESQLENMLNGTAMAAAAINANARPWTPENEGRTS
jgi:hypothetical protein